VIRASDRESGVGTVFGLDGWKFAKERRSTGDAWSMRIPDDEIERVCVLGRHQSMVLARGDDGLGHWWIVVYFFHYF
jgi:hypothetical protein